MGANILGDPVPPDHNWNFTYDAHSTFVYEPGQKITITSDDDSWLFINNQLVIDRGGVNIGITSLGQSLDTLGLTPGQTYSFDLFYAERHTTDAILDIDTNIPVGVSAADQPTFEDVNVSLSAASPVSTVVNFSTRRRDRHRRNRLRGHQRHARVRGWARLTATVRRPDHRQHDAAKRPVVQRGALRPRPTPRSPPVRAPRRSPTTTPWPRRR